MNVFRRAPLLFRFSCQNASLHRRSLHVRHLHLISPVQRLLLTSKPLPGQQMCLPLRTQVGSCACTRSFSTSDDGHSKKADDDEADSGLQSKEEAAIEAEVDEQSTDTELLLGKDTGEIVMENERDLDAIAVADPVPLFNNVIGLPLSRRPVFPGVMHPMEVTNPKLCEELFNIHESSQQSYVGLFMLKDDSSDAQTITDIADVYDIGTLAQLIRVSPSPRGAQLLLMGQQRIRFDKVLDKEPFMSLRTRTLKDEAKGEDAGMAKAYTLEIVSTIKDILRMNPLFKEQMQIFLDRVDVHQPSKLADVGAALTTADGKELQAVLEELSVEERLKKTLLLLKKELELSKLQSQISKQVEEKMSTNQRRYMLMEQLKSIKKELGLEKDEKEALLTKFRERLEGMCVPDASMKLIDEEMEKISALEPASSEFAMTRNYLDWLTSIPWGIYTEENYQIERAEECLEEGHYGMEDVKERIKEFIAVGQLCNSVQGKILCFVGPPGVGKTSIGKSVAAALNRQFYRFSVGGLSDVSEIKGHRRTYVGAMPGKLIQCLKATSCSNPVLMIDEIDKLGRGHQGDPASALLEALDPEQNVAFMDHYMDTPLDLSKVLFLCTANVTDTIPGPLLDRMEIIRLSGYTGVEKEHISEKYLEPLMRAQCGLEERHYELDTDTRRHLIRWYAREAGVRNLQKLIERICRKVALQLVRGQEPPVVINKDNLDQYVGKPRFNQDRIYNQTPVGVVMGLAWTSMGGSVLYMETLSQGVNKAAEVGSYGSLSTTGQLGDVMNESSQISLIFARRFLYKKDVSNDYFHTNNIHLHVPEGATPKDGPSAGCTMVTSLLSLAMDTPARQNMAMTGEITLTGQVLPIGGVKEKAIAAKQAGIEHIILPEGNRRDFLELPDALRGGLTVHYASTYQDVFNVAFPHTQ